MLALALLVVAGSTSPASPASPQAASPVDASAPASAHVFLEAVAARPACFVHEPIVVRLRLGVDAGFFATNALQMFHRELDLPVRVEADWLAAPVVEESDRAERKSIALNDVVVRARRSADEVRSGRTFTVVELDHRFEPQEAGTLTVPEATLRYACATRFEEDLLRGRVALDRQDVVVRSAPLSLRVDPWPEAGRPAGFTGAVGTFELELSAAPPEVRVGEPFQVTLQIEGEGGLDRIEVPRLGERDGFHLFGLLETKSPRRRTVTMELSALRVDLREIPPLAIDYLDPGPPPSYRRASSQPLPLRVLPGLASPAPPSDPKDAPPQPRSSRSSGGAIVVVLTMLAAVIAGARRRRRRRLAEAASAIDPAARFQARLAATAPDVAFAELLATRLHCPTAAVIAPDLERRLVAAGIEPKLAQRAAQRLEDLVADRYRGPASAASARTDAAASSDLATLVVELEAAFRAAR